MYITPQSIKPTKTLAGCVAIYENAWKDPYKTIADVEGECTVKNIGVEFRQAAKYDGSVDDQRTNKIMVLSEVAGVNEVIRNIHNSMFELVHSAVSGYVKLFHITEDMVFGEPLSLLKYDEGEEFKSHHDGGTATARSVSALLYLNDDYEGGELEFVHFDIKFKPKAGSLVLFPSNFAYEHIAHPVSSGLKYVVATFILDQIPHIHEA